MFDGFADLEFESLIKSDLDGALDWLLKGAGHRYLRRVPTGNPKRPFRYIYTVDSKHHDSDPAVGEKIRIDHGEEAGHYEVTKVHGDHTVTVRHDETGHEKRIKKGHLFDLFKEQHTKAAIQTHLKLMRVATAADQYGTGKQKKRALDAVHAFEKRYGLWDTPFKMPSAFEKPKPSKEARRKRAMADYNKLADSATRGAGQTQHIAKRLASLRREIEKLGGWKGAEAPKPEVKRAAAKAPPKVEPEDLRSRLKEAQDKLAQMKRLNAPDYKLAGQQAVIDLRAAKVADIEAAPKGGLSLDAFITAAKKSKDIPADLGKKGEAEFREIAAKLYDEDKSAHEVAAEFWKQRLAKPVEPMKPIGEQIKDVKAATERAQAPGKAEIEAHAKKLIDSGVASPRDRDLSIEDLSGKIRSVRPGTSPLMARAEAREVLEGLGMAQPETAAGKQAPGWDRMPPKAKGAVVAYRNRVNERGLHWVPTSELGGREDKGKGLFNTRVSRTLNEAGWSVVDPDEKKGRPLPGPATAEVTETPEPVAVTRTQAGPKPEPETDLDQQQREDAADRAAGGPPPPDLMKIIKALGKKGTPAFVQGRVEVRVVPAGDKWKVSVSARGKPVMDPIGGSLHDGALRARKAAALWMQDYLEKNPHLGRKAKKPKAGADEKAAAQLKEKAGIERATRRKHVEVGEHVEGSRADKAKLMSGDDVERMTPEEKAKFVKRDKIIDPVDVDAELESGTKPSAIVLKHTLQRLVTPKPKLGDEADYVRGLDFLQRSLSGCKTDRDVAVALEEMDNLSRGQRSMGSLNEKEYRAKAREMARPVANPGAEHVKTRLARLDERLAEGSINKEEHEWLAFDATHLLPMAQEVLRKHFGSLDEYPGVSIRRTDAGTAYHILGATEVSPDPASAPAAIRRQIEALGPKLAVAVSENRQYGHKIGKAWIDAKTLARRLNTRHGDLYFASDEARLARTHEHIGKKRAGGTRKRPFKWTREVTGTAERIGGTPVDKADAAALSEEFKLKNVQFGNWISEEDAEHHLKAAHGGLRDLAEVLGIDAETVALNGRLSLGFGARGSGKAKAHYEPTSKIINLTKFAGGGSLAHEWGHFLDNVIANQHSKRQSFMSDGGHADAPAELGSAFRGVMDAMKGTEYAAHAVALGDYWARGHEMFARAFESYLQDKLEDNGRRNSYLVDGTRKAYTTGKFQSNSAEAMGDDAQPYPQGEERKRLNATFDTLIAVLKKGDHLKKALESALDQLGGRAYADNGPRRTNMDLSQRSALLESLNPTAHALAKSLGHLDLEKAEGERGGHVIGHTSSGKAIYASKGKGFKERTKGWSTQDHKEAARHHNTAGDFSTGGASKAHREAATAHSASHEVKEHADRGQHHAQQAADHGVKNQETRGKAKKEMHRVMARHHAKAAEAYATAHKKSGDGTHADLADWQLRAAIHHNKKAGLKKSETSTMIKALAQAMGTEKSMSDHDGNGTFNLEKSWDEHTVARAEQHDRQAHRPRLNPVFPTDVSLAGIYARAAPAPEPLAPSRQLSKSDAAMMAAHVIDKVLHETYRQAVGLHEAQNGAAERILAKAHPNDRPSLPAHMLEQIASTDPDPVEVAQSAGEMLKSWAKANADAAVGLNALEVSEVSLARRLAELDLTPERVLFARH